MFSYGLVLGDEGSCKIKGKGIPSLARVLVTELFEAPHAILSCELFSLPPVDACAAAPAQLEPKDFFDSYMEAILSPEGAASRVDMFRFQVTLIVSSRR